MHITVIKFITIFLSIFLLTSLLIFLKYFCELNDYCVHLFGETVEMKLQGAAEKPDDFSK